MPVAIDPSHGSAINPAAQVCSALKTNGEPCSAPAMRGQVVCRFHGGSAPQNIRAARRRLAMADASKALSGEGYEPVSDPIATVADIAGRFEAISKILEARVAALNELGYTAEAGEQVKAEVQLLLRTMSEAAKWSAKLADLGIEDRRVRVEEAQLDLMAEAMRRGLAELGLDNRYDEAITVVARHVAELEAATVVVE